MSFLLLGILNAQAAGAGGGGEAFELIDTAEVLSNTQNVEFANIPNDYTHLQLRATMRSAANSSSLQGLVILFNNDSGSTYSNFQLRGSGGSKSNFGGTDTKIDISDVAPGALSDNADIGLGILDIYNYSNSNMFTSAKFIGGGVSNNETVAKMSSHTYGSTSSVSIMKLQLDNAIAKGSFSLYGIRGA